MAGDAKEWACWHCGASNKDWVQFCASCAAQRDRNPSPELAAAQALAAEGELPIARVALVIGVAVAVLVGAFALFMRGGDDDEPPAAAATSTTGASTTTTDPEAEGEPGAGVALAQILPTAAQLGEGWQIVEGANSDDGAELPRDLTAQPELDGAAGACARVFNPLGDEAFAALTATNTGQQANITASLHSSASGARAGLRPFTEPAFVECMRAFREVSVVRQRGNDGARVDSLAAPLDLPEGIDGGVALRFTIRVTMPTTFDPATGATIPGAQEFAFADFATFYRGRAAFIVTITATGFPYGDDARDDIITELAERSDELQ